MRNKAIDMLGQTIEYVTFGTSVILFAIVGKWWLVMSIFLWAVSTGVDMLFGWAKSKYITNDYDSRIFGRSIIKRGFILVLGGLLTIIFRHIASFFDGNVVIFLGAVPIFYFHLFTLQEISSISEHGKDIDPDDRGIEMIHKSTGGLKSYIVKVIDKRANQVVGIYDYLSPIHNKRHLNR